MTAKRDIERELIFSEAKVQMLEARVESLQGDKDTLNNQVLQLQGALMSVNAPDAYHDMRAEKDEAGRPPLDKEEIEKRKIMAEYLNEYLNNLEKPLLQSKDDLEDLISSGLMRDLEGPESLHGNDES